MVFQLHAVKAQWGEWRCNSTHS